MSEAKFPDAGNPSEEVEDEVMVNDSLGTIDSSDSTGTDVDKEVEAEQVEREVEEEHN